MESGVEGIKELFYKDKLQEAFRRLRELEAELASSPASLSQLNAIEEIKVLREDLREADRCLELLADLDSWSVVKDTENIAIFSKKSDSDFIIRAEMLLDQPMFPVLSICNEIDLLPSWIQVVDSVKLLDIVSGFRKLIWYKFNIPWPASNRDMVVNAFGITIPENNSIMLILRNISTPSFLGREIPPPDPGHVRIELKTGLLNFMKRGENQTQVSFISHSDPHVAAVPETLLNWCTQTGIYYFIKSMQDQTNNFAGSVFQQRVNSNPDFYQHINDVLKEMFDEHQA
jgi:hypothetical protein